MQLLEKIMSKNFFMGTVKRLSNYSAFPKPDSLTLKKTFAPFIMQKTKLSTLQEQKCLLKNMLMQKKDHRFVLPCGSTLLLHVKRANYVTKL